MIREEGPWLENAGDEHPLSQSAGWGSLRDPSPRIPTSQTQSTSIENVQDFDQTAERQTKIIERMEPPIVLTREREGDPIKISKTQGIPEVQDHMEFLFNKKCQVTPNEWKPVLFRASDPSSYAVVLPHEEYADVLTRDERMKQLEALMKSKEVSEGKVTIRRDCAAETGISTKASIRKRMVPFGLSPEDHCTKASELVHPLDRNS